MGYYNWLKKHYSLARDEENGLNQDHIERYHEGKEPTPGHCKYLPIDGNGEKKTDKEEFDGRTQDIEENAESETGWGDENQTVAEVGDGVQKWKYVKGKSTKEAKEEISKLAMENLKAQDNFEEVGEAKTPALRIGNILFKIPLHNLFHSAGRRLVSNGSAMASIGDVLNASIEVPNIERPMHYRIAKVNFGNSAFVLITAKDSGMTEEIVDMQTLYSVNVKAESAARELNHTDTPCLNANIVANIKWAWQHIFQPGIKKHISEKGKKDA